MMRQAIGLTLWFGTLLTAATVHFSSQAEVAVVALGHPLPSLADSGLLPPRSPLTDDTITPLGDRDCDQATCLPPSIALTPIPQVDPEFTKLMQWAQREKLSQRSLPQVLQAVSEKFVGATYQEHLLDRPAQETLFASLKEFDCVLFVETVLALSRSIVAQDYTYTQFTQNLQAQRYWDGKMDGYCSRLHYFSAWIQDNANRNTVIDMSATLGGKPLSQPLNFMSRQWQKYPKLQNSAANRQCIQAMEARIDAAKIHYVPRSQVASLYAKLQPGDIVAITTDIPGLDVTHTGLVYRTARGNLGLIHAAPQVGVKISPDLQTYVDRVGATGILVARPRDPRLPQG
jgi:Protein of unknown function (DUF1460)